MTLAIFRLIEPARGHLLIDGVDVAAVGVHTLRRRLTIIPQDPVLFAGSLRSNLDPFGRHSDAELWAVIHTSGMAAAVLGLRGRLDHDIGECGSNLR